MIAVNVAYALYVSAGFVKTVYRLRVAFVAVSIAFIIWAVLAQNWSALLWNVAFGAVHLNQIRLLEATRRSVQLTADERAIGDRLFPELEMVPFFNLWSLGVPRSFQPEEVLLEEGAEHDVLMLILDGEVVVEQDGIVINSSGPNQFLGEIGYLLQEPASATVRADGPVSVRIWHHDQLDAMQQYNRPAYDALMLLVGRELARKV